MYIDLDSRRLCFGAHEGKRLRDLPTTYISWALRTIDGFAPDERRALEAEYLNRGDRPHRSYSSSANHFTTAGKLPADITGDLLLQIVAAGRQSLARRLHPDTGGGDLELMKRVNVGADYLEAQARALVTTAGGLGR